MSLPPVRPASDLRFQIESGIDMRDWDAEDLRRLMEDSIVLQTRLHALLEAIAPIAAGQEGGSGNPLLAPTVSQGQAIYAAFLNAKC